MKQLISFNGTILFIADGILIIRQEKMNINLIVVQDISFMSTRYQEVRFF